jgi:hypothetical protein
MSWSLLPTDGSGLHLSTSDGCVVKTRSSVFSPLVGKLTNPPNRTDDEYTNSHINDITSVRSAHKNAYFLLGGDFNLPDLEWPHRRLVARTIGWQLSIFCSDGIVVCINIFLCCVLAIVGDMQRSTSIMSWSLLPTDGSGLHLSTSDGCVVKTRSSVFSPLVGKLTNLKEWSVEGKGRTIKLGHHNITKTGIATNTMNQRDFGHTWKGSDRIRKG